jgi:sugar lactone lactonase YvrE
MKLFCRVLPLPIVFLYLVSLVAAGAGVAAAQSITFAPAEKPIALPSNVVPYFAIAADPMGNVYFPDELSPNVDKVSTSGAFSVAEVSSGVRCVGDVKTDLSGNLYIADGCKSQLVKITPSGATSVVTSVNGIFIGQRFTTNLNENLLEDFAVDGAGNVYISDPPNLQVLKVAPSGAQTAIATGFSPAGIAVDANANVYVADDTNNRVVKIAPSGGQTVIASGLNTPIGVAVDGTGNVYVVNFVLFAGGLSGDKYNSEVIKITPSGSKSTVFDGFSSLAGIVQGIAVDSAGDLFVGLSIGDTQGFMDGSIIKVQNQSVASGTVNFGGNVSAPEDGKTVALVQPVTFTFHSTVSVASIHLLTEGAGNLDYFSATGGTCTAKTYTAGQNCTVNVQFVPTQTGIRAGMLTLNDASGNVLSAVNLNGIGAQGAVALDPGILNTVLGTGLKDPSSVAVDGLGNTFIADKGNNRVLKLSSSGVQTTVGTGLASPTGVAVDGAGTLYISDTANDRIVKVSTSGQQTTVLTGLNTPDAIAVDGAGTLYVADSGNNRIVKLSPDGTTQSNIGTGLSRPTGVALDQTGDVFVADFGNSQIVEVKPDGTQTTVASGLSGPAGVAVDAGGNVYVAEVGTSRITMLGTGNAGTNTVVVGSGLNFPFDAVLVAVSRTGDVFIADTLNNRVLKVDRTHASMNFGSVTVGQSSAPQTVFFSQIGALFGGDGTQPLVFSDSTDFHQETSNSLDCGNGLPVLQCNITITFTPKKKGTLTGTITLNGNPSDGTQVVQLSGTGQ